MQKVLNFIGGEYQAPLSGCWLDNVGPADGRVIGSIADSDASDVDAAVNAAAKATQQWSETPIEARFPSLSYRLTLVAVGDGLKKFIST